MIIEETVVSLKAYNNNLLTNPEPVLTYPKSDGIAALVHRTDNEPLIRIGDTAYFCCECVVQENQMCGVMLKDGRYKVGRFHRKMIDCVIHKKCCTVVPLNPNAETLQFCTEQIAGLFKLKMIVRNKF